VQRNAEPVSDFFRMRSILTLRLSASTNSSIVIWTTADFQIVCHFVPTVFLRIKALFAAVSCQPALNGSRTSRKIPIAILVASKQS
jgi:hypothetical protein